MANINVNDLMNLNLTGANLFNDSESFMTELSDESEQMGVIGGAKCQASGCNVPNTACNNTVAKCLLPTCKVTLIKAF